MPESTVPTRCSFCSKDRVEVAKLVAGPGGVYICDECVALCVEIVDEPESAPSERPQELTPDKEREIFLLVVRAAADRVAVAEQDLRASLSHLSKPDVDWEAIAASLGTSPEDARIRFSDPH